MLDNLPVSSCKGSSQVPHLFYVKRGCVSLQTYGFCIDTYGGMNVAISLF